jgi:DNA-binding HxlR family transcriptional regulator
MMDAAGGLQNARYRGIGWRRMGKRKKRLRSHCPVNYGLEAFGDRWALLILRDIVFRGKRTYGEFLKSEEGFATNILASRLDHLIEAGILRREGDETDGRKGIYSRRRRAWTSFPCCSRWYSGKRQVRRPVRGPTDRAPGRTDQEGQSQDQSEGDRAGQSE